MKLTSLAVFVVVGLGAGCGSMPTADDGGASGGGGQHQGSGGGSGAGLGGGVGAAGGGGGETTGGGGGAGGGATTGCSAGETRACCGTGLQACAADGTWGACSVSAAVEVCNGLDDDCNGLVDDGVAFSEAERADAGALPDGGCSAGVGACLRTGGLVCGPAGKAVCGALPADAGVEVCNGIDDDCDGQIDEGLLLACASDPDGDGYASDNTVTMVCPDPARPAFGNCPTGFVAPASSLGLDCAPADGTRFTLRRARTDADGDRACVQAAFDACAGTVLGAGLRDPADCTPTDDCNDADPASFRNALVRADADDDGYCVGTARSVCIGAVPGKGSRLIATCQPTDDCSDTDAARYQTLQVRVDADNDGYCSSAAATAQCTGAAPQPGTRLATACNVDPDCDEVSSSKYRLVNLFADADGDQHCLSTPTPTCVGAIAIAPGYLPAEFCLDQAECNDGDATIWRTVAMRRDQDNDGYCGGTATTNLCVGNSAPSGYRFTCPATLDCRDTNPNATTSCTATVLSDQKTKYCAINTPVTETLTFSFQCPTGFYATGASSVRAGSNCLDGSCTIANAFTFTGITSQDASFSCEAAALGHDDWKLSVTCNAF